MKTKMIMTTRKTTKNRCQDCIHRRNNWCKAHEGSISKKIIFAAKCKDYRRKNGRLEMRQTRKRLGMFRRRKC